MAQTFLASSDTLSAFMSIANAPITAMDELYPHRAHFALFNSTGSASLVKIREVSVTPLHLQGVTVNTTSLSPITAYSGGTVVTPMKVSTANETFPSTVEIRTNCVGATLGTGTIARSFHGPGALLGVTVGYPFAKKNILQKWGDATTAETQKYTLRNGEGIGMIETNSPDTTSFAVMVTATIRLSDTGSCYYVTGFADSNFYAPFVILNNGYTSGNVEVLDIKVDAVRGGTGVANTADVNPVFSLAILEGYNATNNGEAITPRAMDSTNTLNSYIKLYKNLDVGYYFSRAGNLVQNTLMLRATPQSSRFATPMLTPVKQTIFKSCSAENDLVVREGSGIAVLLYDAGALGSTYTIDVVFTQESTTAGAVYPSVGDVEASVQYGPTGTDYTGTLVQPATTNVLSGVQYGAGGTEFTGTATGGGGFISIVNE